MQSVCVRKDRRKCPCQLVRLSPGCIACSTMYRQTQSSGTALHRDGPNYTARQICNRGCGRDKPETQGRDQKLDIEFRSDLPRSSFVGLLGFNKVPSETARRWSPECLCLPTPQARRRSRDKAEKQ